MGKRQRNTREREKAGAVRKGLIKLVASKERHII